LSLVNVNELVPRSEAQNCLFRLTFVLLIENDHRQGVRMQAAIFFYLIGAHNHKGRRECIGGRGVRGRRPGGTSAADDSDCTRINYVPALLHTGTAQSGGASRARTEL